MQSAILPVSGASMTGVRLPAARSATSAVRMPKMVVRAQAETTGPAKPSTSASKASGVTIEYQRQRAKEMTKYYQDVQLEKAIIESQVFGWTERAERSNGRWVMFGLLVGMLTEYATGVNFPEQVVITLANLGVVDLY
eukprot:CAMPEP_0182912898 /NCGR_PEP_ID=MMETSP0034_2-20130328/37756_1 /TAXON_ID=156128 /ORGANISM="Nephroselmis pyriformis, Strain CCMP717" /LENGTH=137 /DNA_ID=CAMNT_0025049591 /DNA_START=33 /DNA_END=446 /DNA_ORIENTATION=+